MTPSTEALDALIEQLDAYTPCLDPNVAICDRRVVDEALTALRTARDDRKETVRLEGMDKGVDFVFDTLAKALGLPNWQVHEGSEEWEGDVHSTLMGILNDSGVIDPEDGAASMHKLRTARTDALEEAAKVVEASGVSPVIAELDPRMAEIINRMCDEIATAIRALSNHRRW